MFESVPGWLLAPRPQHARARVHGDPLGGRTKTDQHLFGQGGLTLRPEIQSKIIAMAFSMAAEIERDLISQRTKEALRFKKAQGMKLGRQTGPGLPMIRTIHPTQMIAPEIPTQTFHRLRCRPNGGPGWY